MGRTDCPKSRRLHPSTATGRPRDRRSRSRPKPHGSARLHYRGRSLVLTLRRRGELVQSTEREDASDVELRDHRLSTPRRPWYRDACDSESSSASASGTSPDFATPPSSSRASATTSSTFQTTS